MRKRHLPIFVAGLPLMSAFLAAAWLRQSAYMLYAASLMPVFIVPFIPDIRSSQTIKPSAAPSGIRFFKLVNPVQPGTDLLIIDFLPRTIKWKKQMLFFPLDEDAIPALNRHKPEAASLSVLKFDLMVRRRRRKWYGIHLRQLAERTSSFSFTTDEVTRLVIQMQDLRDLSRSTRNRSTAAPADRRLQV